MINILTKIIALFNQEPDIKKMGFLSTFFVTPPDGFTDSEFMEYDIVRSGMEVAPVIRNLFTGAVTIVDDTFTNKNIPFPVIALDSPVNIAKLMSRQPGESAYQDEKVNWLGRLSAILVRQFSRMVRMVRYNIELQAAQVLQTAKLSLKDEDGNVTYEIDFKGKPTHFPQAAVWWDDADADVLNDIEIVSDTVRNDGYVDVVTLIFGSKAWKAAYNNKEFREAVKRDNLGMGQLNPYLVGKGGKCMGYVHIGSYRYDLYLYNGIYTPWGSTTPVTYVEPENVIFLPAVEELDLRRVFGGIPNVKIDAVFDPIFGGKIPIGNEYDFRGRVYFDEKKETYVGEVKSRPVHIPVSIDRFACMQVLAKV